AHYEATGPEIWKQTDGRVNAFICAVGSGGTLAGTAAYLRELKADVRIGLADVPGASLYSWFTDGVLKGEGTSIAEGIGVNRITGNLQGLSVDHAYRIEDAGFLPILFDLVSGAGLSLGSASGGNIAGAIRRARGLGPGARSGV